MEKLIELLNEFYKEEWDIFRAIQHNDRLKIFELENDDLVRDTAIISKQYWFIKRLVDNDKIDFESENYPLKKYYPYFDDDVLAIVCQDCNTYEDRCKVCYDKYESLLMLLAIQDSPLKLLISVLK